MAEQPLAPRSGLGSALARTLPWAGLATLALAASLVMRIHQVPLVAHLYVAVLGLLAAVTGVMTLLGDSSPGDTFSWRSLPWRRRRPVARLRSLQELEHAADFALSTAFDVHYRLCPHLRRIAEHRLANRGVRLAEEPERARLLLGTLAWGLIRPDRPPPEDRNAAGLKLAELRAVVGALEAV